MSIEKTENVLKPTRHWNERYSCNVQKLGYSVFFYSMHPYLFFSNNGTSIFQVGLQLELQSNSLMNTYTKRIVMNCLPPEMLKFLTEYVNIPFHNAQ